ncbi:hypothetical protein DFH08DRAFT_960864 [Mycena albidolilacea]|uniref:Uncharacterized protein n=1 Tax=Mycena albidolilacea TaxID=1033008 RepID=A0AAD7A2J9_9AGAR|nr:hypothetical protein DFH08DRAFT_960864 [Mycena albidolilacea]
MRKLYRLQEQLGAFAVTSVLQPNFCWKRLAPAARKARMLEGLLRTCSIEPLCGPKSRMLTCDIILSKYVPDDEAIERLQTAGDEAEVQGRIAVHDDFVSAFLLHIISPVIGITRPSEVVVKSDSTRKKLTSKSPNTVLVYRIVLICDAEAVFLLRRIGPVHNGYARSAALVRQITYLGATPSRDYVFFAPMGPQPTGILEFLRRLVFSLTVQTAMAIERVCARQLVQEYGETSTSASKLVQGQLSAPSACAAVTL